MKEYNINTVLVRRLAFKLENHNVVVRHLEVTCLKVVCVYTYTTLGTEI